MSAAPSPPLVSPASAHWYGVVARYRQEKKVAAHLIRKDMQIFLPLLPEVHHWSDREKHLSVPLFPGYVFVQVLLSQAAKLQILQTQGVLRLVTFGSDPAPVPSKQIEHLQVLLASKLPCALHPFLQVGQKVRIRGGCLDGVEGILVQKERNLIISVACIQRSVAVKIEGYELELI